MTGVQTCALPIYVCTRLDDAICVAALTQCILSKLFRLRRANQRWRIYPRILINENRWRAQRYGVDGALVDFGVGALVPFADLVEELIELVREDAEALDCVDAVEHARVIVARGTGADRQRRAYDEARAAGADHDAALRRVVDHLIEDSMVGLDPPP